MRIQCVDKYLQEIDVTPYQFSPDKHYLSSIVLEVDFFNKKNTSTDPFNSDDMAKEFSMQFCKQAFTVGMQCVFSFQDKKLLSIVVKVSNLKCFGIWDLGGCFNSQFFDQCVHQVKLELFDALTI